MGNPTPGPWAIAYPAIYAPHLGERVGKVADASIAFKDTETYVANARLIAAAPDLLQVMEELFAAKAQFDADGTLGSLTFEEWEPRAKAAIAKARGQ